MRPYPKVNILYSPATFEYDPSESRILSYHGPCYVFLSKANAFVKKVFFILESQDPLKISITLNCDKKDRSKLIKFLSKEGLDCLESKKEYISFSKRDECIKILTILTTYSKIRIEGDLLKYINTFISALQLKTNNLAVNETDAGYYSHLILKEQ